MKKTKSKYTTLPNVRTNQQLKNSVFKYCTALGISYGTLINLLLKEWIKGKFKIEIIPQDEEGFAPEESKELLKRAKEAKAGLNIVKKS